MNTLKIGFVFLITFSLGAQALPEWNTEIDGDVTANGEPRSCSAPAVSFSCGGQLYTLVGCRVTCAEEPRTPICASAYCDSGTPRPAVCYCNR